MPGIGVHQDHHIIGEPGILDHRPSRLASDFFRPLQHPVHFIQVQVTKQRRYHPALGNILLPRRLQNQPQQPQKSCRRTDQTLVVADTEHYTVELLDYVTAETPFDLLVPMPNTKAQQKQSKLLPDSLFNPRWAGFATAKVSYQLRDAKTGPHLQYIQRCGEKPEEFEFKSFLSTRDGQEVDDLTREFPKRWHIEEFFNAHQALGWQRAGTLNLNIRYGQMTLALVAQAAIHQFRKRGVSSLSLGLSECRAKIGAFRIDGCLSTVQNRDRMGYGKSCCLSHLQLG